MKAAISVVACEVVRRRGSRIAIAIDAAARRAERLHAGEVETH